MLWEKQPHTRSQVKQNSWFAFWLRLNISIKHVILTLAYNFKSMLNCINSNCCLLCFLFVFCDLMCVIDTDTYLSKSLILLVYDDHGWSRSNTLGKSHDNFEWSWRAAATRGSTDAVKSRRGQLKTISLQLTTLRRYIIVLTIADTYQLLWNCFNIKQLQFVFSSSALPPLKFISCLALPVWRRGVCGSMPVCVYFFHICCAKYNLCKDL